MNQQKNCCPKQNCNECTVECSCYPKGTCCACPCSCCGDCTQKACPLTKCCEIKENKYNCLSKCCVETNFNCCDLDKQTSNCC